MSTFLGPALRFRHGAISRLISSARSIALVAIVLLAASEYCSAALINLGSAGHFAMLTDLTTANATSTTTTASSPLKFHGFRLRLSVGAFALHGGPAARRWPVMPLRAV
jgi:hypothetical protein